MTKYQIVTNKAREAEIIDAADAIGAFEDRGYVYTGGEGGPHLRPELRGQPKFTELCGPMWGGTTADGTPIIRYEDWGSYEVLSR